MKTVLMKCEHCGGAINIHLATTGGDCITYCCDTCGCRWEWRLALAKAGANCPALADLQEQAEQAIERVVEAEGVL